VIFVSANLIHPLHRSWLVGAGACGRLKRRASAAIVEEGFWKTNIATEHVAATATVTDGHALRAVTWLIEREGRIVKGRVSVVPERHLEVLALEKLSAFFTGVPRWWWSVFLTLSRLLWILQLENKQCGQ